MTEPRVIDGTTVYTDATTYTVSCLPDDPHDGDAFSIAVQFRGGWDFLDPRPEDQQWAVILRGCWHLNRDGEWDFDPGSDGRDDAWYAAHRFNREEALKMAAEQAPHVKANGMSVTDVLKWRAAR